MSGKCYEKNQRKETEHMEENFFDRIVRISAYNKVIFEQRSDKIDEIKLPCGEEHSK